jgi:hypothetical protein
MNMYTYFKLIICNYFKQHGTTQIYHKVYFPDDNHKVSSWYIREVRYKQG